MSVKREVIRIDIALVRQLLERARGALSPEDYATLASLIETLIELTKLVRQDGTTLARLRRMLGQVSSEKTEGVFGKEEETGAGNEEHEGADAEASEKLDGKKKSGTPPPKGHGRISAAAYPTAQHIAVPHQSLHVGDRCPHCARGNLYALESAQIPRILGQAPLVAICWELDRLRCGACGDVYTASPPPEASGPKYAESAVAMMTLLRYGTGVPLNRLDRLQRNLQIPLPASTQWQLALENVAAILPVHVELNRLAASGNVLHNDDTYVRILDYMGKRRAKLLADGKLPDPDRTGLFTTAIVSQTSSGPIALFFSGRQHAGENLTQLLKERTPKLEPPIQMCDALDRNLPKGHAVLEANCLAHGRRHIVDEASSFPEECRHVLKRLREVFKNEKICRQQGLSGEERLHFHQQHSGPVMFELEAWMKAQMSEKRIEPNSGLGDAFNYLLKRWDKLTLFLRVPNAPIENNIVERAMKKAIIHRNNSLFYRSQRGASVGDVYMSLIYTAELHGESPFHYLTALLRHQKAVVQRPADWLPWTYRATLARIENQPAQAA